jgi:hypothetical protein
MAAVAPRALCARVLCARVLCARALCAAHPSVAPLRIARAGVKHRAPSGRGAVPSCAPPEPRVVTYPA